MSGGGGSQSSLRRYLGAIKDTTTVSLAKVNSDYKELDIAIVKATNHVERPSKERYIRAIFMAISATRPRADVAYCIHALARRLSRTHNWAVALKTLIVIHRALREVDQTFHEEVINYSRSRSHMLNMSHFKDDSGPNAWAYSAWVRFYALFLEERLECFRVLKYDVEVDPPRTKDLDTPDLLEQLPALQELLFRVLDCQPEGAAVQNHIIQLALSMVISESTKIYQALTDGIDNLVDKFFDMQRNDAVKALDMYRRAVKQAGRLSEFFEVCKSVNVGRGERFIKIEQPPTSFLQAMEEYVKEAPLAAGVKKEQVVEKLTAPKEILAIEYEIPPKVVLMEAKVPRPRGRPRKRQRLEDDNRKLNNRGKKQVLEVEPAVPISLLGCYMLKDFDDNEVFLGKIVSYDTGLYRVIYEDGDCEELESGDLRRLIISDSYLDDELRVRRKKLDKLILKKEEKKKRNSPENKAVELPNQVNGVQARAVTNSEDGDSYSDSESSESGDKRGSDLEIEAPLVPPVDLPPSSGTIGIPEEAVAHLLSVYGFLRSFSFQLYICPFELNDFVGALYFSGPNSLLDAVHVALLRALKGHLERLSSSKSVLASKCLRCIDWSLLDVLTWPVYLVQYFTAMGHASGPQWNIFNKFVVEIEYYSLPIGMKLKILQILCDDIFDVADLRDEIDAREESEIGFDPDRVATGLLENVPRRVHPRFAKTSAYKEKEVTDSSTNESKDLDSRCTNGGSNEVSSDLDGNSDECRICGMDGTLLCCDGCPLAYHSRCIGVVKMYIPDGPWFCPECTINKKGPKIAHGTSLRGAVQFGMDPHGRLFLGTCNHLLVLNISVNGDAVVKYYNVNDISKVVLVLISASSHTLEYVEICKAITQYWDLPEGISLREGEIGLTQAKDREDGKVSEITKSDSANISNRSHTQTVFDLPTSTLGNTNSAVTGGSCGIQGKKLAARVTYLGLSFKPNTYNNHYTNGELAVSAAASLAVLSSEETHEPDLRKYNSAKKAASSNILEQMKAFSLVAPRFFWPSPDKKEITRERCGWCHSCRLTSASRRGCMLNAAVAGATKGAMKIFSGLFPLKNGEGVLSSIAAYILYLEESLRGLIAGPFLSESPRKQWRKQVEEASTCKALKAPLLELEENICSIALSCDWFKQMDDWLIEHSIFQSAPVTLGVPQRRGPGRTKQNTQAEVTAEGSDADSFTWWRGGKLSKVILLKAVLSQPATKKAAWQGGSKKIPGLNYGDASYIPRRSRRSFWKAAVESSKNISQLALQVRYLDMSLRWRELVRPDQNLQNVKGPETDVAIFRNARICDKKLSDNKVSYGVFFGNQKHLPSRVMKNIMEVEKTQDRNEKYWLQEAHVPLYLIKEFEESLHRVQMPSSTKKPSKKLSKLQRKQLKASLMDIFSYIASRRDKMEKCSCASCDHDVLLRDTTTCSSCHGFCHKDCTSMSQHTNGNVEVLVTCKRCYLSKTRVPTNINHRQSTAPQFTINVRHQNAVIPVIKVKPPSQQLSSQKPRENTSGVKQVTPDSSVSKSKQKTLSCGVIWRKKNVEDTGVDFRNQNILLAGRSDKPSLEPVCGICLLPYNPGLTYIHCTKCEKWFHTEAVKLKDSQIPEVVGFKCCKCRRIRSPDCPYMDPKLKEQKQIKRIVFTNQKQRQGNSGLDSDSERMSEQKDSKPSTPLPATPLYPPDDVFIPEDDPLLVSVSKVKQITPSSFDLEWSTTAFAPGPQKLPVRRQVKREDSDAAYPELHPIVKPEAEEQALPVLTEWDLSGELLFDYEDMEFEPQTYFSLTELLTADDSGGGQYQENGDMVVSGNPQFEPTEKEECEDDMGPCQRCLQMDPAPDLLCTVCGLLIHSHCSPWSALPGSSWSCGQCRIRALGSITLGSFGAITQFKSILPDRSTKVDISLAGPFAGAALSVSMFAVGLFLSTEPDAANDLVQVPSMLFQGSLLLGLISRATLGYAALHAATVSIHPLVIAGWCGLTTTAFNMLPVGCLDGGRAVQGAFGKNALVTFGLSTYVMLGLRVLGGPLALPWGLYVLICRNT